MENKTMIYNNFRNVFSRIFTSIIFAALLFAGLPINSSVLAIKAGDNFAGFGSREQSTIENLQPNGKYDASLATAIQTARYSVERDDDKFYAANPANEMQAVFEKEGNFRLQSAGKDLAWQTDWKLKSVGRGVNQQMIISGAWSADETKISARHRIEFSNEIVEERFENRSDGLEQVFVVDEKPQAVSRKPPSENLRLVLETSGALTATASADGQKIILSDETGAEVLRYEKLKVWDAENNYLSARMNTNETGEITLEVEDQTAVYPLTIDPTFIQSQRLIASDGGHGEHFGRSVAISGDTAIIGAEAAKVGANIFQGAVYVFVRNGKTWTLQKKLVAADGAEGDRFGQSVAISGETVAIGANWDNIGGNDDQGSVYIFVRNGVSWTAQEKLLAPGGAALDYFGDSVAISGDTVVAGADGDDIGSTNQGSAFVFVRSGGAWSFQQRLTAADSAASDFFGDSVFLSGGTVIIGAPNKNNDEGAAYVFVRSGTNWSQQAKLTASDGAQDDAFGRSVALSSTFSGTIAVVGASRDDVGGNSDQGSAYVFNRSGTTWTETQKLIKQDEPPTLFFGSSVAIVSITGNTIVIGSPAAGNNLAGAVFVFRRVNSVWTQQQRLPFSGIRSDQAFGSSIAISGDTFLVGSPNESAPEIQRGAAYFFDTGSRPFDFDGDGKSDISIFRPSVGQWWYYRSSDGGNYAATFGNSSDKITPGDFTGDGKTDVGLFRPSSGEWFVLRSEDGSFYSFPFGTNGDVPAPADFDGDGKTDAAVFRPSTATWYINKSSGGTTIQQFGQSGDVPAVADYDADGKADIAIWRASVGQWWIQRSTDGTIAFSFGNSADKPVQGDYTGDGKADVAIFRPSSGEWFILRSEDSSYYSFPFGTSGDVPSPGDYDSDGKFDAAIFRPSGATWYVQRTTAGTLIQGFGQNGDMPVPNAFVP